VVGSSHVVGANLLKTSLDFTSNPDSFETMVGRTLEFGIYLDLVQIVTLSIFPNQGEMDIMAWNFPMEVPPNPLGAGSPRPWPPVEVTQASGPFGTAISSLETPF